MRILLGILPCAPHITARAHRAATRALLCQLGKDAHSGLSDWKTHLPRGRHSSQGRCNSHLLHYQVPLYSAQTTQSHTMALSTQLIIAKDKMEFIHASIVSYYFFILILLWGERQNLEPHIL